MEYSSKLKGFKRAQEKHAVKMFGSLMLWCDHVTHLTPKSGSDNQWIKSLNSRNLFWGIDEKSLQNSSVNAVMLNLDNHAIWIHSYVF